MNNSLKDNILHICSVLSKHYVQYLIVGGTAVALHGYFRESINLAGQVAGKPDLDFWYNSTYDNYFRLLKAMQELGQNASEFLEEKTPNPTKNLMIFLADGNL